MTLLHLAEGAEPGRGQRNSYRGQRCVDCPKGHVPAAVWECDDGERRCANHYAQRRAGRTRFSTGFLRRHGLR